MKKFKKVTLIIEKKMKKKALVLKSFKDEKKNKIKRNIKMFLLFRKKNTKKL